MEQHLRALVPLSLRPNQEYPFQSTDAEAFDGSIIHILKVMLDKSDHVSQFLHWLHGKLNSDQRKLLWDQLQTRLDDDCNFFMRFDKRKWMEEQRLWLVDHGYCFHVKITVAAYPKNKKSAAQVVEQWLG